MIRIIQGILVALTFSSCTKVFLSDTVLNYTVLNAIDKEFALSREQKRKIQKSSDAMVQTAKNKLAPELLLIADEFLQQLPLSESMSDQEVIAFFVKYRSKLISWLQMSKVSLQPSLIEVATHLSSDNWTHFDNRFTEKSQEIAQRTPRELVSRQRKAFERIFDYTTDRQKAIFENQGVLLLESQSHRSKRREGQLLELKKMRSQQLTAEKLVLAWLRNDSFWRTGELSDLNQKVLLQIWKPLLTHLTSEQLKSAKKQLKVLQNSL